MIAAIYARLNTKAVDRALHTQADRLCGLVQGHGSGETAGQEVRTERFVNRWITSNTIPITNRAQEIWTASAATPAIFRAPAMTPTTKNISA